MNNIDVALKPKLKVLKEFVEMLKKNQIDCLSIKMFRNLSIKFLVS